ncbi:MAG: VIT1/CCC1 transporter family protein [Deltaproteobacteria bacterium]|nr:VIT1/CCC1 transporter family protein [Deltaproteobacteria bacterium]
MKATPASTPAVPPPARLLANLQTEVDTQFLYETLAALDRRPEIVEVYRELAESERRHAEHWRHLLAKSGEETADVAPSRRARALAWLAHRFGPGLILSTLAEAERAMSQAAASAKLAHGTALTGREDAHGAILRTIQNTSERGMEGGAIARFEGRHRAMGGNALRAAVLGANDGLVSNMSLVMGVAGASTSNGPILIAGLAGLLAGAISMALGEWLSVQSARELYARQIEIEAEELALAPEEETQELALIYQSKGLSKEESLALARKLLSDPETALATLAAEELGIDPNELAGSAWEAAFTSFLLFAVGAIIPIVPFLLFSSSEVAIPVSLAASGVGLFGIGAAITLMTGRGVLFSGLRQTMFGLTAAAITYGIGRAVGGSLPL